MRHSKIIYIIFLMCIFYVVYIQFLRQGRIYNIYQHSEYNKYWNRECKSTVVLVENVPLSHLAQKKMWYKHGASLLEKYNPLSHTCDDILFLKNKTERADDIGHTNYWIGDNQYCLNGAFGEDKCISKEHQLFTIRLKGWPDDEKVGMVGWKPIYLHFIDY